MPRAPSPQRPVIVGSDYSYDYRFRVQYGTRVKHLIVTQGSLTEDEQCLPLFTIPTLPYNEDGWNVAQLSRKDATGEWKISLSSRRLPGVEEPWHSDMIDCTQLKRTWQLSLFAMECVWTDRPKRPSMIAKIAQMDWELPFLDAETRAYRKLEGMGVTPRFLGHIHEHGRIIGLLLEKVDGRHSGIEDLARCQDVLRKVHMRGLVHGDVNRYNFIIAKADTYMLDFGSSYESQDQAEMDMEIASLSQQLVEESGRGKPRGTPNIA